MDPYRKSARGNGASGVSNAGHPRSASLGIRQSSYRRTGFLALEGPIREDVFDVTARHADIHELPVVQAVQLGAFPLPFAPCLKRIPISLEKAGDTPRRRGRLSRPCRTIGRAHGGISWVLFLPRVPRHGRARLTSGLHFPYRRLILCVATDARASTVGGHLRGTAACPIPSRNTHSTPAGASCIAGRT